MDHIELALKVVFREILLQGRTHQPFKQAELGSWFRLKDTEDSVKICENI